jgi:hypothetical protein
LEHKCRFDQKRQPSKARTLDLSAGHQPSRHGIKTRLRFDVAYQIGLQQAFRSALASFCKVCCNAGQIPVNGRTLSVNPRTLPGRWRTHRHTKTI